MLDLKISDEKCAREFEIIKQGKPDGYKTNYSWNEIVLKYHWRNFYSKELAMWEENPMYKGLPLQSYIYLNRIKYLGKGYGELTDREILRAFKIIGIINSYSFHSPFYIQQFIKDYNIKSIYDPCGGWGHRMLGAWNIKYIYNDINTVTMKNCKQMSLDYNLSNVFYNNDAAIFTPEDSYEAVFTCPPYWNQEIYSSLGAENKNKEQFIAWWQQVIKASVKQETKYFAFIINRQKAELFTCCVPFDCIAEIPLGSSKSASHFQRAANKKANGEVLYIYKT